MNKIPPLSKLDIMPAYPSMKRTRVIKSIQSLSSCLIEYIKFFLSGSEIACLNGTCKRLNRFSSFSCVFRVYESRQIAEYEKKFPPSKAIHIASLIKIKAMIGEVKAIPKLADKLSLADRLKVYHQIAKFPQTHPFLKKAADDLDSKLLPSLLDTLLDYKMSPTQGKLDALWIYYALYITSSLSPNNAIEHYDPVFHALVEIEIEKGETQKALRHFDYYEGSLLPRYLTDNEHLDELLLNIASRKAPINFEKALESLKKCSSKYDFKDLLFHSFFFFTKPPPAAELLQQLPSSFFNDKETHYFHSVLTRLAQDPVQDVKEISQNLSDIPFCVFTLCWCAREIKKDSPCLAVKYLEEAIEQAPKVKDPERCLLNFMMIAEVSRKIT